MSKIELYNEDCFDVFTRLSQVDAIIADIPYNINYTEWDKEFDVARAIECCSKLLKGNGNIIIFNGYDII